VQQVDYKNHVEKDFSRSAITITITVFFLFELNASKAVKSKYLIAVAEVDEISKKGTF